MVIYATLSIVKFSGKSECFSPRNPSPPDFPRVNVPAKREEGCGSVTGS